jgi:hypothetical protein
MFGIEEKLPLGGILDKVGWRITLIEMQGQDQQQAMGTRQHFQKKGWMDTVRFSAAFPWQAPIREPGGAVRRPRTVRNRANKTAAGSSSMVETIA